jgi:hypothetical protein
MLKSSYFYAALEARDAEKPVFYDVLETCDTEKLVFYELFCILGLQNIVKY